MREGLIALCIAVSASFSLPHDFCTKLIKLLDVCAIATYEGVPCSAARSAALKGVLKGSGDYQTARGIADLCEVVCMAPGGYAVMRESLFDKCLAGW